MALIKCPECGREISDKALTCPGCGCPASEFNRGLCQEDNRSELDRIADEIFWERPVSRTASKRLAKKTGIPYEQAYAMIAVRYQAYRTGKKQGKFPDTKYCPSCGSQNIEPYEDPGITVTSKANVFGGMYISSRTPSKIWMRCNTCGQRWKLKRR